MISLDAIDITVEDTRIALRAKEDESIGERLEEGLDISCKRLIRLGIMVHDQGDWLHLSFQTCSTPKTCNRKISLTHQHLPAHSGQVCHRKLS